MSGQPRELLARWFNEVWSEGREDVIDELLPSDRQMQGMAGTDQSMGVDDFKRFFRRLRVAFPDFAITVIDTVEEGNRIAARWVATGRHTGPLGDIQPTGRAVRFTGMSMAVVEAGKLAQGWNNWDMAGLLRQLGQMPSRMAL